MALHPLADRGPRFGQRLGTHEQPDVASRRHAHDNGGLWGTDQACRLEDLLAGGDVVRLAGEQIERDLDVLERQFPPQADELALGEAIRLEQFLDRLEIVAPGQIERVLEPALEMLAASDVALVRDVVIEVIYLVRYCSPGCMFFQPASITSPRMRPPPAATRLRYTLIGSACAIRLIGPLPASVSIGAPARTSVRTFPGNLDAYIADIHPPWHNPTRCTGVRRSSTTTLISARYLSMS